MKFSLPVLFFIVLLLFSCTSNPKQLPDADLPADSLVWYPMADWTVESATATDTLSVRGPLTLHGETDMMFYAGEQESGYFDNFELKAEVRSAEGGAGSLWVHTSRMRTGYQILVNNTPNHPDRRKTGSLAGIRNLYKSMGKNDEWVPLHIRVVGKQIEIRVDTMPVVRYMEPEKPFRLQEQRNMRFIGGQIAIQNQSGDVAWRNMQIAPLSRNLPVDSAFLAQDETADSVIRFQQRNFPLIDYHVHLKGWGKEEAHARSMQVGIVYGIAPNCGIGFPVTDDAGVFAYRDSTRHMPFFFAMQGEGREWPTTFSDSARQQFDYVFTDAMTFVDHKGRRTRLWLAAETFVDIPREKYMDQIVANILKVLNDEPIDVYVNPTFLPDTLAAAYDQLWTSARINKVVDALVKKKIALEINARYRIPSAAFIKAAKKKGVKFAFGTNNGDPKIGKLEYCVEMVHACGLTPEDLWFPTDSNRKGEVEKVAGK